MNSRQALYQSSYLQPSRQLALNSLLLVFLERHGAVEESGSVQFDAGYRVVHMGDATAVFESVWHLLLQHRLPDGMSP